VLGIEKRWWIGIRIRVNVIKWIIIRLRLRKTIRRAKSGKNRLGMDK